MHAKATQGSRLGHIAWVSCLLFLICCAWRLARFNVQGMAPGGSKYFVGMPTPAAAGVMAAIVLGFAWTAFKVPLHDWRWSIAWLLLVGALGGLMTSTIRYYSFKDIPWTRKAALLGNRLVCFCAGVIWKLLRIPAPDHSFMLLLRPPMWRCIWCASSASPGPGPRDSCHRLSAGSNRIVIAGASSLLGAELRALLEESRFAGAEFRLVDEEIAAGMLTEAGGEPAVIQPVEEGTFERAGKVFFTGSADFTRANLAAARAASAKVIDLSGASSGQDGTVNWFPKLDSLQGRKFQKDARVYAIPSAAGTAAASLALGFVQDRCIPAGSDLLSGGFRSRACRHRGAGKPDGATLVISRDGATCVRYTGGI